MKCSLDQFRKRVVRTSLFSPCSLGDAIHRLGFVQADPIRCPARAQDLILRHRVKNYRAGDLEQFYPELELEECYLFAYGFLSKELWRNIHPNTEKKLTREQQKAVEAIKRFGPMHPKELEVRIGGKRVRNYWGGFSRSAKLMMDDLHDRGALRVAHREKGIRIYETVEMIEPVLSREKRFQEIIVSTLRVMGATTRKFLLSELSHFGYLAGSAAERRQCLQQLIEVGRVRVDFVDTVEYVSSD